MHGHEREIRSCVTVGDDDGPGFFTSTDGRRVRGYGCVLRRARFISPSESPVSTEREFSLPKNQKKNFKILRHIEFSGTCMKH